MASEKHTVITAFFQIILSSSSESKIGLHRVLIPAPAVLISHYPDPWEVVFLETEQWWL